MTHSAFIEKSKPTENEGNLPIAGLLGFKFKEGDVGLEIEMEGNKFPKVPGAFEKCDIYKTIWNYHADHSLRGRDNAEYVFNGPQKFADVEKYIKNLWNGLKKYGTKLDVSNRTSVHVHLNVLNWHLNRLVSFVALYYAVEDILAEWCGDHRVGNLFCLRGRDAPNNITSFMNFVASEGGTGFDSNMHYAALNFEAIQKYGSIEIRLLRGVTEAEDAIFWVKVLQRLYELSAKYPDPRTICEMFSGQGPVTFVEEILGEFYDPIISDTGLSHEDLIERSYKGIRNVQDVCYCRDWDDYKPKEYKPDPFGRKKKRGLTPISFGTLSQTDEYIVDMLAEPEEY